MLTTILPRRLGRRKPYGLAAALKEGGLIAQGTFGILVIMSIVSFYIMFTKLFEQQKIMNQAKRMRADSGSRTPEGRRCQAREELGLSPDRRRRPGPARSSTAS